MRRILVNAWGDEGLFSSFALIPLSAEVSLHWLGIRKDVEAMATKYASLNCLEFFDWTPNFFSWHNFPEDLESDMDGVDFIQLPDTVSLGGIKPARMEIIFGSADAHGVHWRGREKYSDACVETPFLPWSLIEEAALERPPADNEGRKHCWWCGEEVEEVVLLLSVSHKCKACGR